MSNNEQKEATGLKDVDGREIMEGDWLAGSNMHGRSSKFKVIRNYAGKWVGTNAYEEYDLSKERFHLYQIVDGK